jgi:hypothetical protein
MSAERLRTYVIDADTEEDIPGAAIYLLNPDGSIKNQIATADDEAFFEVDYPPFGTKMQADFPGYSPTTFDPAYILYDGVRLKKDEASGVGQEVIVTGVRKKVIKKPNYTLPIVLGSLSIAVIATWIIKYKV